MDPETRETGPREVIATLPHTDQLLALKTSSGDIITTEDHRYWNDTDREWQESQDLDAGDRLLTADGDEVTVEGLDWSTVHTDEAYDLTVEEFHSFYVGAGDESVLVHNVGKPCNLPSWNKLDIDMEEVLSGHTPTGSRAIQSGQKTIFENMTESQIRTAIRDAYNNAKRLRTQVGGDGQTRVLLRGEGGGRTIEMWVNLDTKVVETAYPV